MPAVDSISIVITTYNRSEALLPVLAGLAAQDDKGFEVIVADDGSTQPHQDAIQTAASRLGLALTHVWHPDVGFTASRVRNLGVHAAAGDYIVLMDGDCVPETDFVRRHRALREQGCYLNGSRVLLSERLTQQALQGQTQVFGRSPWFWLQKRLAGDASKWGGWLRLPDFAARKHARFVWKGIRSCNMGVWRSDYAAVNGFDESFVGWGHEDADFALRLHNAGVVRKNGFYATEVYHLWHHEASRTAESRNAGTVRQRMGSGQVLSTIGYRECAVAPEAVIHRWG
ncbi:MAG: glycosyltransferase family 2 protein [Rhodoferax sp.]|nr:glycosyltransferase family 2 protein [Rhodoferax sp.]